MLISGVQKFTILDYPGKVACMAFTPFCNFRCGYCHNSEFVLPEKIEQIKGNFIPEEIFFNFLKERVGMLDGVVVSGGEPTMQKDLKDFIIKVKSLGFLVKLDTNGSNFKIVKELIDEKLVDFIAMDVKSDLDDYMKVSKFTGNQFDLIDNLSNCIKFIISSGIDYEFRTTIAKDFVSKKNILEIGKLIAGAKKYAFQNFRAGESVLDESFNKSINYNSVELEEFANILRNDFGVKLVEIRR